MANRFKLRIYRAITTTLQSCRSKDPSILPQDPVPSFSRPSSSVKHHHLSEEQYKWQKEDKWHVVAKIHDNKPRQKLTKCSSFSDNDDLTFAPPAAPPPSASEKKKRRGRKKIRRSNIPTRLCISTSSADSGWFSSDEILEEETKTLINFSSPSIRKTNKRRSISKRTSPADEISARLSMFQKMIPCTVDGKVKESFAIVKRSENPYEDFKSSMMDMIVEKQMFGRRDLEQLLECFLSLNSRNYHDVIVRAFSDICDAIFDHHDQR